MPGKRKEFVGTGHNLSLRICNAIPEMFPLILPFSLGEKELRPGVIGLLYKKQAYNRKYLLEKVALP